MAGPALRVLIIDDSAYNRKALAEMLSSDPDIQVVGKAADGEEGLRLALQLQPDVITLDLEMPRMDGFTFLRILMTRRPTPVVVVSSYAQKENVFKALELGALDFVAKPENQISAELLAIQDEFLMKVRLVKQLSQRNLVMRDRQTGKFYLPGGQGPLIKRPRRLVAVAASTGGPSAISELFARLPGDLPVSIVIAQHMPDKFTRTFAERLSRRSAFRVVEAADGDTLEAGSAFIAPGRQCIEVRRTGEDFKISVVTPAPTDRYVPSADRLFATSAIAASTNLMAIVLTGMGDDGCEGIKAVRKMGGLTVAEAPETAVIFGMPGSAVRSGCIDKVLPLGMIPDHIVSFAREVPES